MRYTKLFKPVAVVALPALIALVIHACKPLTVEDVLVRPTVFGAVGSTALTGTVGGTITNPGEVGVLDQDNEGIPGMNVTYAVSAGTIAPASVATNAQGHATAALWTLPTSSGTHTLTAALPGSNLANVVFTTTLAPGPATAAIVAPGTPSSNNQSAPAGTNVSLPAAVRVNDQYGNGISNIVVTFTIQTGGGTVNNSTATTATATTNASGVATMPWTLGQAVGSNTLRAVATGLATSPVTFTATGVTGPVNKIVITPGTPTSQGQSAIAGTTVTTAPSVLITDQFNNPIATGVVARFAVTAGVGKVLANSSDATGSNSLDITANASGIATVFGWRLGTLGANTLTVTIPSATAVPSFAINATGTAGPPASIAVVTETPSSNNQTAVVNNTVAVAPGAVVSDAQGNVAAGVSVTFTVGASSGTVRATSGSAPGTSASVTTDANGIARLFDWKLGNRGANTLNAVVASNPSLTTSFSATGTAGPPASIAIITESPSSNNQTTIANTNTPVAPGVEVRDANNLTVDAGHNITFAIVTGGGLVSTTPGGAGATTVSMNTDANGVARLGYWKPGTVGVNANTMRASVTSTSAINVLFTASGTVGPPTQIAFTNQPWPFTVANTNNGGEPKVTVKDAGGNGISGLTINWSAGINSTVGGTTTSTTNASGVASFLRTQGGTWTAANVASGTTMALVATVSSAPSINVTTTSTIVGPATQFAAFSTPPTSATVFTVVSPNPVVIARDGANRPVPGALLSWVYTVNPSNGSITSPQTSTDSVGQAHPGTWRLAQLAGSNSIRADLSSPALQVVFTTTGVAGAAAAIAVNAGNNQTVPTGSAVPIAPSVVVRDQFGNLVGAGTSVTFTPATGSGSVTGSPALTTGATGIATVGSWTLGSTAGAQTLNAFATASPSVTVAISATATDQCATSTPYTIGTTVSGTLATTDCATVSGTETRYADLYSYTTGAGTTSLSFTETPSPANFEPQLRSIIWPGASWGWRAGSNVPVNVYLLLAQGSYVAQVTTALANTTGGYQLSSVLNPTIPSGCVNWLVTTNINVTHSLDGTCTYISPTQSDTVSSRRYIIHLPANTSATVGMNAGTLADPYLECFDVTTDYSNPTFITGCFDDDGGGVQNSLMIIASTTASRFIMIRATHFVLPTTPLQSGTYTLNITTP